MGDIQIFRDVHSRAEGFNRTIRVFTPERYRHEPRERFGVLYMQDGQNVFEHPESARHPTWAANHTLEWLVGSGAVGPWMIVAVDHGQGRFEDYSPWDEPRAGVKARGDTYARFLIDELKPWVDRTWRTRPEPAWTAVSGSSLGGLISLYLHWRYGEVFPRVGALSPSVMWSGEELFRRWTAHPRRPSRIYVDAGATEGFEGGLFPMPYGEKVGAFCRHLQQLGYADWELKVVLDPCGQHSEADWQRRLPDALRWLLAF
jgi:predicted alpha/beta superfamily hydrolase